MNAVERVLRTIDIQEADRVPRGIHGTTDKNHLRLAAELRYSSLHKMYKALELDIWHIRDPLGYVGKKRFYNGLEADCWGIPLICKEDGNSSAHCPLSEVETVDEVEAYEFPSISDFDTVKLENELEAWEGLAIEGGLWAPIFHDFTWLCGFENALSNLILMPDVSKAILHRITDFWVDYAKKALDAANGRIHIMKNCNDFGTQRGLIFSREIFVEFFKPELQRIYDVIKSYGVKVMQHSCGAISEIIGDFIEMGADIINPVQVAADGMDIDTLSKKYAGKVCFYGGIDTQHVLPQGTPEIIATETRKTLAAFSKTGGYILCPSQGVESDIPAKNILIMLGTSNAGDRPAG